MMSARQKESKKRSRKNAPADDVAPGSPAPATFSDPRILLVPIDFSEMSRQALQYAGQFAVRFQSRLVLLHVVETASYLNDLDNVALVISEPEMKARAVAKLAELARPWQAKGLEVVCEIGTGRAYQAICQMADSCDAGMIVISTHGYTGFKKIVLGSTTGFKKIVLGSTTERVVQNAPCPVLVLRADRTGKGPQK